MKCYTSVSHGEFYQRTRFHAITLAQLKATMQNLFLARTRYVPIHSKMQPGSDPTASCSFSFSRFLFDAASSDVVHPAFLHISQSYSSLPLKTFPQWPDLCVFFSRYLSLNEPRSSNLRLQGLHGLYMYACFRHNFAMIHEYNRTLFIRALFICREISIFVIRLFV